MTADAPASLPLRWMCAKYADFCLFHYLVFFYIRDLIFLNFNSYTFLKFTLHFQSHILSIIVYNVLILF